jgi:nuclear pore complex protein Nup133
MFFRGGHVHSVLNEAVFAYMNEVGEGHHEDFLRAFFRLRVGDIGDLVPRVTDIIMQTMRDTGRSLSTMLPEANEIILVRTSFSHEVWIKLTSTIADDTGIGIGISSV